MVSMRMGQIRVQRVLVLVVSRLAGGQRQRVVRAEVPVGGQLLVLVAQTVVMLCGVVRNEASVGLAAAHRVMGGQVGSRATERRVGG